MSKKVWIIIGVILVLGFFVFKSIGFNFTPAVDWRESFNERSNKPYGVSVLHKEFPKIFKDHKFATVFYSPETYFYANSEDGYGDFIAEGNFVIIGNSDYLSDYDVEEILLFTERGNTLFISDYEPAKQILDTLQLTVKSFEHKKDSTATLGFSNFDLKNNETKIDRHTRDYYFESIDTENHKVLGYISNEEKRINFISVPYGSGEILLHLEPKIFTNYNVLKDERYKYVEGVLSYFQDNDVYFDSYTKLYDSYYGNAEQESDLSWFLEQNPFRWAWYLALLLTLLFVIFNAKRRQRIIQPLKPIENTTLGFVKTISNLYFETKDHKNLVLKKITYFLAKVREDYNIDTSKLDEEFVAKLASKSGKSETSIAQMIKYINWLRSNDEFIEQNLINLNKHIEAFYSK